MKAKKNEWDQGKRENLVDILPLEAPLAINVEVARACNFKCAYCYHALNEEELKKIYFNSEIMNKKLYFKMIDDCKSFKQKIKTIRFAGLGEPLINKNLPEMIKYTREKDVCNQIVIFTNASLLTEELSNKLVEAGTDIFRIAIQGLTSEEYYENSGVKINLEQIISNIKYLYMNKGNCKVFIKILDFALKGREDLFYKMFGDICDEIAIENVIPRNTEDIDYDNLVSEEKKTSVERREVKRINVCPFPYYQLNINADGSVSTCFEAIERKLFIGNIKEESVSSVWNGEKINDFRVLFLKESRFANEICSKCISLDYCVTIPDMLDGHEKELLKYYYNK